MSRYRLADARLVRRAALVIAIQTASAAAIVVAGVAVLVLLLNDREQGIEAQRMVQNTAVSAVTVSNPPSGMFLVMRREHGRTQISPGAPASAATIDVRGLRRGADTITLPNPRAPSGRSVYLIYTVDREDDRVVAALDTSLRTKEGRHLVSSAIMAGLAGIVGAGLVGWLIGWRAVRPLGTALSMQRRFVADASHELRTPLTILHTRAQMIARNADVDARTRRDLDRLISDSRALGDIVTDLLRSAELQHNPEAHEPIDLGGLAGDVVAAFGPAAESAGIVLRFAPDETSGVMVSGAAPALRRAINALVDNALAHTPPGGHVTVTVRADDDTATLEVVDDGEGLDPKRAAELTERFARGSRDAAAGRRFGLGLALVREVVETHGGRLRLEGELGKGATATITLRLDRRSPAPDVPGAGADSPGVPAIS